MSTRRQIVAGSPFDRSETAPGAGVLWLVPDGAVAWAVRDRWLEVADSLGSGRVWTLEEAAASLLSTAGERWIPISRAVRMRLVGRAMARLGAPCGGPALDPLAWPGVRRRAARLIQRLREAEIPPEILEEAAEGLPRREAGRVRWLAGLLRAVVEAQGMRGGAADEAEMLGRAAALLGERPLPEWLPGVSRVVVYGFSRLSAAAVRFVAAIRGVEAVEVCLPPVEIPGVLSDSGPLERGGWRLLTRQGFTMQPGGNLLPQGGRRPAAASLAFPDEASQWAGVAGWVADRLAEGLLPRRIAVVTSRPPTPDSALVRALADRGISLAEPVVRPGTAAPLIQFVLSLLELAQGLWSRAALFTVASDVYAPDGRPRHWVLARRADPRLERAGADGWMAGVRRALEAETDLLPGERRELEDVLTWLAQLRDRLAAMPEKGSLSEWADALEGLLEEMEVERALRRRAREAGSEEWEGIRQDLEAYAVLRAMLREWRETDSWVGWPGRCTRGEWARWLREELEGRRLIVRPGQEDGIRVVSPETAWVLDLEAAVVPDVNEGIWPPPEREEGFPESLYDVLERRGYEWPRPAEVRTQHEEHLLRLLATPGIQVALTYIEAEGKLPSRILEQLWRSGQCLPGGGQEFGSVAGLPQQPGDPREAGPPFAHVAQWREWEAQRALAAGAPEIWMDAPADPVGDPLSGRWRRLAAKAMIEKLRESPEFSPWEGRLSSDFAQAEFGQRFSEDRVYSVSMFNDYGTCPFRFLLRRVWKIEVERGAREPLDALEAGLLYHRVLSGLFREVRDLAEAGDGNLWFDIDRVLGLLDRRWGEEVQALEERLGLKEFPTWSLQRERMRNRIWKWVAYDWSQRQGSGLRPRYFEWAFGGEDDSSDPASSPTPMAVEGLLFQGRVDRIDADAQGRFIVYDYKRTTGGGRHGKAAIAKGIDVQLPLYMEIVRQVLYPDGEPLGAAYYGIERPDRQKEGLWRKGADHGLGPRVGLGDEEWRALINQALDYILEYHGRMRAGDYPVAPGACLERSCEFGHACRKHDVLLLRKGVGSKGEDQSGAEAD
ncbi:PD-(D/E)XK nuclease family protein [Kyrpidia spormannii]|uniref:Uncharacterized protein n=1 Tax=Kyrpidia spormannii TaxID=2055160 RepID=A0ACA8Z5T0_9BACL|nr:PD-(D/E)XK nuclease family protein [Kyrpidia spormannii]CAB3389908.1 conserved protein of unknown function [Kyrpidia spormannii]